MGSSAARISIQGDGTGRKAALKTEGFSKPGHENLAPLHGGGAGQGQVGGEDVFDREA